MNPYYTFINNELKWLEAVIVTRLKLYFQRESTYAHIFDVVPPSAESAEGEYAAFIEKNRLNFAERVCLILSLVPTLKPQLLDCLNIRNSTTGSRFVEFGCVEAESASILLPTFETVLFVLSGDNVEEKIRHTNLLSNGVLFRNNVISLQQREDQLPLHYSVLRPSLSSIELLINERHYYPDFSASFPASRLTTQAEWGDLVLDANVMKQIDEIKTWIEYGERIMKEWDLGRKLKPGYRVLFHGASGTGKTFTAALLGKYTGRDVYRIDLSTVVSKYIGETEKNLSNIFEKAENKKWILFFDEADALFGKRTNINDSHDRYANQEISFLLQRIENYNGLVVLSTNLKRNIDEAFTRRFQSIIHFPSPKAKERLLLWQKSFSPHTQLEEGIDLEKIAAKCELTGGSIVNIVQYCSLMAMKRGNNIIVYNDLMEGVKKEFQKAGITIS